jgi:EmrB/QacA subfamily drug resistance transporter
MSQADTADTTGSPAVVATGGGGSKYLALTAMVFAVAMTFIDQTIVSIAVPNIQTELGLSSTGVQWVVNGYLLALAATFALGGRLSDILGHRRMVLVGVTVFAVSSALCGATPKGSAAEAWIVAFRVVQGIGAAILFPAALAIVVSAFDLRERGKALAIFFGISGGLTAIGPILGGWLTQYTWRAIFWVNIPVAIIAVVLTLMAKVHTRSRRERLDYPGAILVAVGMALSVFGLQQSASWGWDSWKTWACIIGGLIVLAIFVRVELRTAIPLIKVRIFADRAFFIDNAVLFFSMMAFVPVFFFASVYGQLSLGLDANGAGLYLLIYFAGFATASQIGGRMLDSVGAKPPVLLGCALAAVGYFLWGLKLDSLSEGSQWPYIVMAGAGVGFLLGPASTDAVNRAIDASYGEVTGITQTLRNYGSSLGFAVLGAILLSVNVNKITLSLVGFGLPEAKANEVAHTLSQSGRGGSSGAACLAGVPPQVPANVFHAIQLDVAQATRVVFDGMAVALVVALLFALLHPGGKVTREKTSASVTNAPVAPRD